MMQDLRMMATAALATAESCAGYEMVAFSDVLRAVSSPLVDLVVWRS